MKTFIKTMRILNVGFVLGAAFIMWLYNDEIEKGKQKVDPYTPSDEFNNIYNHYNSKEATNA
jgi:hypothetical protein